MKYTSVVFINQTSLDVQNSIPQKMFKTT